jgi:hypothetical protein
MRPFFHPCDEVGFKQEAPHSQFYREGYIWYEAGIASAGRFSGDDRVKRRATTSDRVFHSWITPLSIALIVLSMAFGAGVDLVATMAFSRARRTFAANTRARGR